MSVLPPLVLAIGLLTLLRGLRLRGLVRRLGRVPEGSERLDLSDAALPSLSIVAAARDEEEGVERAVRSWLGLGLPGAGTARPRS